MLVVWPPIAIGDPPGGLVDDRLGDEDALVEAQRGEVASRSAGEKDRVPGRQAAIDEEPDMSPDRIEIDLQVGVAEHRRDRDVAALETAATGLAVHDGKPPQRGPSA